MSLSLWGILVAVVGGFFISFQSIFNADLQRHIGLVGLMSWVHLVGFIFSVPLLLLTRQNLASSVTDALRAGVPWYVLLSGIFGLFIVPGVAYAIAKTTPAIAFSTLILGQLVVALFMQQAGLFGTAQSAISWTQVVAVGLVVAGVGLFFFAR